jgi:hypothetical protein
MVVWVGSLVKPSLPEGSSVMCRKSAGKAQACLDPAEVVYLPYDGGKEDPVDLNRQDEGEVEEQSGGIPQ